MNGCLVCRFIALRLSDGEGTRQPVRASVCCMALTLPVTSAALNKG